MSWLRRLFGRTEPETVADARGMDYLTRARLEIPTVRRLEMDKEAMRQWRERSEKRTANIAKRKI